MSRIVSRLAPYGIFALTSASAGTFDIELLNRAHKFVIVGLAHHKDGGEWLVRLVAPMHDLVVSPHRVASAH